MCSQCLSLSLPEIVPVGCLRPRHLYTVWRTPIKGDLSKNLPCPMQSPVEAYLCSAAEVAFRTSCLSQRGILDMQSAYSLHADSPVSCPDYLRASNACTAN